MAGATKVVVYSGSLPAVVFEGGYAERGVPVEVDAALAGRLCEQRVWNEFEPQEVTVDELKKQADERGIKYPSKVKKDELVELLAQPESEGE